MIIIDDDERKVTFDDSQKAKDRVFEILRKWFGKEELFSAEALCQSDKTYVLAPDLLGEIAEKGFKFKQKWKE